MMTTTAPSSLYTEFLEIQPVDNNCLIHWTTGSLNEILFTFKGHENKIS